MSSSRVSSERSSPVRGKTPSRHTDVPHTVAYALHSVACTDYLAILIFDPEQALRPKVSDLIGQGARWLCPSTYVLINAVKHEGSAGGSVKIASTTN
jgi:hypothetical protein